MTYTNPITYQINLTPNLRNLATEGGLDTSVVNGVSLQRTVNMVMTSNCVGDLKVVGSRKDGESYDDVVSYVDKWITITDTMWLYPVYDVNTAIEAHGIQPKDKGRRLVFQDMASLYAFYEQVFMQTAISQPVGNVGYSMGVGTVLKDLGVTVNWELESGLKVVTWRLVEQLTSQSELPPEHVGDSPDGTIGFVTIYADWNNDGTNDDFYPRDIGYEYGDPGYVELA
jgi:hypothetical protein